jgi:RNA polymerase sigma-70 factor (ECF subfamily)
MTDYLELVLAAQHGTEDEQHAAFNELVARFQGMVFYAAYRIVEDRPLAEDVTQEVFLTAYLNRHQLRDPLAFPSWLKRIVMTRCDRQTRGVRPTLESLDARADFPSDMHDPADVFEENEMVLRVQNALRALPEHERLVTEGFYLKGESQQELSERLQIPVTTVKKRLQYAREHLRAIIGDLNAAVDYAIAGVLPRKPEMQPQPIYVYRTPPEAPDEE